MDGRVMVDRQESVEMDGGKEEEKKADTARLTCLLLQFSPGRERERENRECTPKPPKDAIQLIVISCSAAVSVLSTAAP